jgi:hypothetical protein
VKKNKHFYIIKKKSVQALGTHANAQSRFCWGEIARGPEE